MIRILPPEEARKIAAGEVIDRPASLARELLDNAIDAGALNIALILEEGGNRLVEVSDDGCGMNHADLELCWLAHATSKIGSLEDLNHAETLGFRGEALAAAAAVSHLDILSSQDGREAWRLEVGPEGHAAHIERARRVQGTSVRCLGLFDTIPARKRFLKRAPAEASLCRVAFTDKALCFPGLAFKFVQDGKAKCVLAPSASFKERFAKLVTGAEEAPLLHEIQAAGEGFTVSIVVGSGELARVDRRQQFIFANGRRIQDFSLQQALEYGVQGAFPNGLHPVGAIFIKISPELADFNIHPAKREARFADGGTIHHAITEALINFGEHLRFKSASTNKKVFDKREALKPHFASQPQCQGPGLSEAVSQHLALAALLEKSPDFAPLPGRETRNSGTDPSQELRFVGRAFDLFVIVEQGTKVFFIDQHAAHERILYEKFKSKPLAKQDLLVPISFTTDSAEDDAFLEQKCGSFDALGIALKREGERWCIEALPVNWRLGDDETVRALLDLRGAGENIAERWAATLACHAAIKDGTYLGEDACIALAEAAFALPDPHCPHGRPIWFELEQDELLRAVKRN